MAFKSHAENTRNLGYNNYMYMYMYREHTFDHYIMYTCIWNDGNSEIIHIQDFKDKKFVLI